jgi:hypothetical protein
MRSLVYYGAVATLAVLLAGLARELTGAIWV